MVWVIHLTLVTLLSIWVRAAWYSMVSTSSVQTLCDGQKTLYAQLRLVQSVPAPYNRTAPLIVPNLVPPKCFPQARNQEYVYVHGHYNRRVSHILHPNNCFPQARNQEYMYVHGHYNRRVSNITPRQLFLSGA